MSTNETPAPLLRLTGISKTYPGTKALTAIDLTIGPGEVVALLGENGAGKSTLSSVIAGVVQPTTGTLTWRGEPYSPSSPADSLDVGIGLIHQEMRLLPDLSVAENVLVGRLPVRGGFVDASSMRRRAEAQLRRLGFAGHMDQPVRSLSVAGQQQVEIAKALTMNASLLILDEPTAALGAAETDALFGCVQSLKAEGVSFIYVSHRLAEIARIADRIVVLRDGRQVAEHDSGSVPPAQLVREMVGRNVDRLFPELPEPTSDTALHVSDLTDRHGRFSKISFEVHRGEIFGIAGIVGAGRTELVRSIAALEPRSTGIVRVDGTEVAANQPGAAIASGIALIPEDRKQQGLILGDSIEDNIALANLSEVQRAGGWIEPRRVHRFASEVGRRLSLKGDVRFPASYLSGGNQQKVVLAKWLARKPKVVILDEPTRGIDVGARAAIYDVIVDLARDGVAVIVVSSDLEEVLGLSHRVMVLAAGESQGILPRAEASPDTVMHLAVR
jgi:ribose transport system ATP-binding protein